jgi:hypothetical protein
MTLALGFTLCLNVSQNSATHLWTPLQPCPQFVIDDTVLEQPKGRAAQDNLVVCQKHPLPASAPSTSTCPTAQKQNNLHAPVTDGQ